jgi:hypothetical protein
MRVSVVVRVAGLFVASALPLRAEIDVRVAAGRVDLVATKAPLSEVLKRLGEQTGMKVAFEGVPPAELVTLSFAGRSPVEAVNDLLRERGLNYALSVEASGRVSTLVVVTAPPPPAAARKEPSAEEAIAKVRDILERGGLPEDASIPKAEDVLPRELVEAMFPAAAERQPVEIPEGSPLRALLPGGSPSTPDEPRTGEPSSAKVRPRR